ncbi:hypothetical protein [Clostridium estertheticum]|uniref:hypothetical protein n=1 Tax=Clostridium estertheticum TaxID=238834 RepID=UPI0025B75A14|nr:hypothetical protein [Clostridium estertheticum]
MKITRLISNIKVLPCSTEEFKRPTKKPKSSVLRNYMLELTTDDKTKKLAGCFGSC